MEAKLEEDPNLLGTIQGLPPPPAPAPSSKPTPSSPRSTASSAEVKALKTEVTALTQRVSALETENAQLKVENEELRKNGNGGAVGVAAAPVPEYSPARTPPTRRGSSDAKDLLRKRLSIHGSSAASMAKADESEKGDLMSEHPDWEKKYSDQHKRVYWKHKVSLKTIELP